MFWLADFAFSEFTLHAVVIGEICTTLKINRCLISLMGQVFSPTRQQVTRGPISVLRWWVKKSAEKRGKNSAKLQKFRKAPKIPQTMFCTQFLKARTSFYLFCLSLQNLLNFVSESLEYPKIPQNTRTSEFTKNPPNWVKIGQKTKIPQNGSKFRIFNKFCRKFRKLAEL